MKNLSKSELLFTFLCSALIFGMLFAACKKNKEIDQLTAQLSTQISQTRSEISFDLQDIKTVSCNPVIIRTVDGKLFLVDGDKVYIKDAGHWMYASDLISIKPALISAINAYKSQHPDDIFMPEPPLDAIAAWAFSDDLHGTVLLNGGEWYIKEGTYEPTYRRISRPMPCPRACDRGSFSFQ